MCQSYLMMDVLFGEQVYSLCVRVTWSWMCCLVSRCTACVSELPDYGCVVVAQVYSLCVRVT